MAPRNLPSATTRPPCGYFTRRPPRVGEVLVTAGDVEEVQRVDGAITHGPHRAPPARPQHAPARTRYSAHELWSPGSPRSATTTQFLGVPDRALLLSWEHCRGIALAAEPEKQAGRPPAPSGYTMGIDSIAFAAGIAPLLRRMRPSGRGADRRDVAAAARAPARHHRPDARRPTHRSTSSPRTCPARHWSRRRGTAARSRSCAVHPRPAGRQARLAPRRVRGPPPGPAAARLRPAAACRRSTSAGCLKSRGARGRRAGQRRAPDVAGHLGGRSRR